MIRSALRCWLVRLDLEKSVVMHDLLESLEKRPDVYVLGLELDQIDSLLLSLSPKYYTFNAPLGPC